MRKCRQLHQQFTHTHTERLITKQTIYVIGKQDQIQIFLGPDIAKHIGIRLHRECQPIPFALCVVECRYRMSSKDRETDISQAVDQLDRTSVNK